jgi:alpha-beta hydrolase superfamily lysophospholipase
MPANLNEAPPFELIKRTRPDAQTAPLVCVHGAWHGAWCWEPFLDYFAQQGYSCYAPSLRGHGASSNDKSLKLTRIDDYVEDVRQTVTTVVSETGGRPVLIGHSMGGLIVQKYLETDPEIPKAFLLAPVPVHGVWQTALRILLRMPLPFIRANLTWSLWPLVSTPQRTREHFFSKTISDEKLGKYFANIQDESYLGFLDMLLFRFAAPKQIKTPVIVMGALEDTIFTPAEIEKTAAAYGREAVMFADMAHDMMLEDGWKQVADSILKELDHLPISCS